MMNYLTNQIARNRNEVETLQPRIPSRFEPQTTALHFEKAAFESSEDSQSAEEFAPDVEVTHSPEIPPIALPSLVEEQPLERDVEATSAAPRLHEVSIEPIQAPVKKTPAGESKESPVAFSPAGQSILQITKVDQSIDQQSSVMVDLSPPMKTTPPAVEARDADTSAEIRAISPEPEPEIRSLETPSNSDAKAFETNGNKLSGTTRTVRPRPRDRTKPVGQREARQVADRFDVEDQERESEVSVPIGRPITKTAKARPPARSAVEREKPKSESTLKLQPRKSEFDRTPAEKNSSQETLVKDAPSRLAATERESLTSPSETITRQTDHQGEPRQVVPRFLERARTENPTVHEPVDAGPTVNISIGRIEVRATTAPATAAPKARHEHVLSLEQYLKQRVGGGGS